MKPVGKKGQEVDVLMSARSGSNRNEATIARSGKRKWGYDTKQVDAFLDKAHALYESADSSLTQDHISNAFFDMCKDGYTFTQVDAALARLQRAVSDRTVSEEVNSTGLESWTGKMVHLYTILKRHADREGGSLFSRGRAGHPSYDCKQVDRLISQILARAAYDLNMNQEGDEHSRKKLVDITSDRVANVIFTQRKGKRGYDEREVDYYLSKSVELLQDLESTAKLDLDGVERLKAPAQAEPTETDWSTRGPSGSGQSGSDLSPSTGGDSGSQTEIIKPLIGQTQSPAWQNGSAETSTSINIGSSRISQDQSERSSSDFAQLHQAEQAIFDHPQSGEGGEGGVGNDTPTPTVAPLQGGDSEVPESDTGQSNSSLGNLARSLGSKKSGPDEVGHTSKEALNEDRRPKTSAGHDWSMPPSFAVPPATVQANQSDHNATQGENSQPEEGSPMRGTDHQPQVQSSDEETSQVQLSSPSWAQSEPKESEQSEEKPDSSQNLSNKSSEDPDSYLASLLNVDLPKMDLDIPDISFPGLDPDQDSKDNGDRDGRGQDQ